MTEEARAAIVTGAGRGLGRAMALGLARAGWRVLVTASREGAEIRAVEAEAEGRILAEPADVTQQADCRRTVLTALERFGRLDLLVNNAGRGMKYVSPTFMTKPTRFWETDPAIFRAVIDTNLTGPFQMSREAVPSMREAGWGRIVNISMNRETMNRGGFIPYGPSKAGLEALTAIMAQDLEGSGITVNALLPGGATLTGMIPDVTPESVRRTLLQPEIMVAPLLWLASREADTISGRRLIATRWRDGASAQDALEPAGCL